MTSLYYSPRLISGVAGSKLTFTATGTVNPQNIYQDEALTTPHTNPVIADSSGTFAPIYLDPRLPSYRVKWTTSANVLIDQRDGVPSNQNIGGIFRLESVTPTLVFYDTDGTVNQRKLKLVLTTDGLELIKLNDAESVETTVKKIRWEPEIIKTKASDAPRVNNSLLIDPDLQYTFDANVGVLYEFEAFLIFRCASATPGTSFQFNCSVAPSAGTCRYVATGSSDAAAGAADYLNYATTSNTTIGWAWTNAARHITNVRGYINVPANGSTFALYWAQTITNATAMNLEAGSFLRLRQVAI